jgi:hypothetical protein
VFSYIFKNECVLYENQEKQKRIKEYKNVLVKDYNNKSWITHLKKNNNDNKKSNKSSNNND